MHTTCTSVQLKTTLAHSHTNKHAYVLYIHLYQCVHTCKQVCVFISTQMYNKWHLPAQAQCKEAGM